MEIKVVKLYENGFMTGKLALGGEGDAIDAGLRFPSSRQNFLIDTGSEVILVDTGMPKETPDTPPNDKTQVYMGTRVADYVSALEALGYKPEQVSKILVTHKHPDHTGELRAFPNAKVYIGKEDAEALKLSGDNIICPEFSDGPYHNFPRSQKIAEGVWYIPARGHTKGNCIVIAEKDGLFYMMHGDVTYTDEALVQNKLSIIYEDKEAARTTLDQVRAFIKANPTVYLSTHTPFGVSSLENKTVMKLD